MHTNVFAEGEDIVLNHHGGTAPQWWKEVERG
jgi:hypothetical protein